MKNIQQFLESRSSRRSVVANRNGSALVIVLGLLAVMLLMAVTFAITMRTERGGATNLRHSIVSRQMLDVAISRIMNELDNDETFYTASEGTNTYERILPIAPWYMKSSVGINNQHFGASVLFSDVQQYFFSNTDTSLSQRAAIRQARPEWMPIYAGVKDQEYDSIQGRYAYVILNNSGRMNINSPKTQSYCDITAPTKPYTSIREYLSKDDSNSTRANGIPLCTSSLAYESRGVYTNVPTCFNNDNYSGVRSRKFDLSGDPKSPDYLGQPDALNVSKDLAKRLINTFGAAFQDNYRTDKEVGGGNCRIIPYLDLGDTKLIRKYSYNGTAAQRGIRYRDVATMALLDYIDDDMIPGGNNSGSYSGLIDAIKEDSGYGNIDPLNLPCTEPVPLFNGFFLRIDDAPKEITDDDGNITNLTYEVSLASTGVFLDRDYDAVLEEHEFLFETTIESVEIHDWDNNVKVSWKNKKTGKPGTPATASWTYPNSGRQAYSGAQGDEPVVVVSFSLNPKDTDFEKLLTANCTFVISAKVYCDGTEIQSIPGPLLADNDEALFRISSTFDYEACAELQEEVGLYTPEEAWAYVVDPRFGYYTMGIPFSDDFSDYPIIWVTGYLAYRKTSNPVMKKLIQLVESNGEYHSGFGTIPHGYMEAMMKGLTGDKVQASLKQNQLNLDQPDFAWMDKWNLSVSEESKSLTPLDGGYPMSVGELGNLLIAPLRTISLYDGINRKNGQTDKPVICHTVLDLFTTKATPADNADPVVDGYPINLNPSYIAEPDNGDYMNYIDVEPLASAWYEVNGINSKDDAFAIAEAFYANCLSSGSFTVVDDTCNAKIPIIDGISRIGGAYIEGNELNLLPDIASSGTKNTTHDYEEFLTPMANGLTTRQQLFTIIVQADAFTPAFGFSGSVDGSALASSKAIMEIWRDPEPRRNEEGFALCCHGEVWTGCAICHDTEPEPGMHKLRGYKLYPPHDYKIRYIHYF